jgi:hypothetical protein
VLAPDIGLEHDFPVLDLELKFGPALGDFQFKLGFERPDIFNQGGNLRVHGGSCSEQCSRSGRPCP